MYSYLRHWCACLAVAGSILAGCNTGQIEGGALLYGSEIGTGGAPGPVSPGCAAGQLVCGGFCVDIATSVAHCGGCDMACPAGSVCSSGVCRVLCGAGQLDCGGACKTVASDLTNCGACGAVCAAGQFCSGGVCSATCNGIQCLGPAGVECADPQTNPSHCGGCGLACLPGFSCVAGVCTLQCPQGLAACGSSCVNLASDASHCGFCGNTCQGQPCVMGQCGCGAGTLCNGVCADLTTNRANCGACGVTCGDGANCVGGACVCGAGQTLCGAACVDPTSNVSHCGACNAPCGAGQVCSQGVCSGSCPPGTRDCAGSCVDLASDRANCGTCGTECTGALTCTNGSCGCPDGASLCGSECIDLTSDSQHCGTCETVCAGGQTCVGSSCSCATGQLLCDGVCVTSADNPQHCGTCGNACVGTQSCEDGTCECPSGETLCGDTCIDLAASNENCGECGNACAGGQTCAGSICRCSDGMTGCGELCIDTQTSSDHCGACDTVCPTGRSCVAGQCSGVVGDGPDDCSGEAHSIQLTKIALLQGVEVALMEDGNAVPAASRSADAVAGREAVVRVFFDLGPEWVDREVSARLHLTTGDQERTLYRRQVVTEPSAQSSLATTIQIPVEAAALGTDSRFWVEVVECEASLGTLLAPRFPASGDVPLEAEASGPVKVAFVPVEYTSNGTTWVPDTSDATIALYSGYLGAMYPATAIEASVTSMISTPAPFDFSTFLDDVRAKRSADAPADDVYYFGLVKPAASMRDYCGGSCTTGMAYVVGTGRSSASFRAGSAVAFGNESTAATIAHELGHNHGREHAPCGVSGDASYPYSGGLIGIWGFDRRSSALQDPAEVADIMSYCRPQWVSDYTFQAFFDRIQVLNGVTSPSIASIGPVQPWRVALTSPAGLRWGHPLPTPQPPEGDPEAAVVLDALGQRIGMVDVYVVKVSEVGHATVLVPEPLPGWAAIEIPGHGVLPFAP